MYIYQVHDVRNTAITFLVPYKTNVVCHNTTLDKFEDGTASVFGTGSHLRIAKNRVHDWSGMKYLHICTRGSRISVVCKSRFIIHYPAYRIQDERVGSIVWNCVYRFSSRNFPNIHLAIPYRDDHDDNDERTIRTMTSDFCATGTQ